MFSFITSLPSLAWKGLVSLPRFVQILGGTYVTGATVITVKAKIEGDPMKAALIRGMKWQWNKPAPATAPATAPVMNADPEMHSDMQEAFVVG